MKTLFFLSLIVFISCSQQTKTNTAPPENSNQPSSAPDFSVALKFINEYVSFCSPTSPLKNDTTWIRNNALLTDNFKKTYYALIHSDPDLDSDPIFDAQDFPESGFVLDVSDEEGGYVTVKGKDWPEFLLVLKVVQQGNKTLVDGSGIINIPTDKKAKR